MAKPVASYVQIGPRPRTPSAVVFITAVALVLVLGVLLRFGAALFRRSSEVGPGGFGVNRVGQSAVTTIRSAPDLALDTFAHGQLQLSALRGQVVVLNFWASWCPPCREEARTLASTADRFQDRDVAFVGINVWDAEPEARVENGPFARFQRSPLTKLRGAP